ncbi:MAG TPA: protein kinase [Gemmatimonadaceae bacterium]|nr:protein kinase [Gemmatimonadaceae bacterium]
MSDGSDQNDARSAGASNPRPLPPPSPEEWRRLEPLVDAVLDAAPDRRDALIAELSGGDAERRVELERLVAECERDYPLLDRPAMERFASVVADETMPPLVGKVLAGRYRVEREAGRGGMAIVYLAHDLKHGRDVAIKVVRPELAVAIGRERFLGEIEIAARLRHPHIVPLYDSGELPADEQSADGDGDAPPLRYYVMPYEAGHSLRERLERDGPLPVADVVLVLRDLCGALSHAHHHGVVHRDIKPDNVLLSGGHALITDFGVARASREVATQAAGTGTNSTIRGTPTYMAPEQAVAGAVVDRRADIYAVGVLAYELLVGRTPSADEATRATRAPATDRAHDDVAKRLTSLRPEVPGALAAAVAKCLAERPADRWQSADDLLTRLDSIPTAARAPARRALTLAGIAAAVVVAASLAAVAIGRRAEGGEHAARAARSALVIGRAAQLTSDPGLEVQPSMSPDGRRVAYAAGQSLRTHIVVRPAAGGRAVRLTSDTVESEWYPRWSPDGTRVLFLANRGVFSAPAAGGGAPRLEVPARHGVIVTSATWSPDGREIAYVRGDSLLARASGTGRVRLITTGPDLHSCSWSPDGGRIACVAGNSFYVTVGSMRGAGPMFGNSAPSRIVIVAAAGGRPVSVTDSVSLHQSPVWSRDGRTLYYVSNREGPRDVYALDVSSGVPRDAVPVRVTTGMGAQSVDASADWTRIVYSVYTSTANVWAMPIPTGGRGGSASAAAAVQITSGNQTVEGLRVSPDGRWLVYDSDLAGNSDVYRVPVTGGEPERLTRGAMDEFRGAMSPSGAELAYHTFATGSRSLFLLALGGDGGGPARQLTRPPRQGSMANWSPDGDALAFFDMGTTEVMVVRRDRGGRWGAPRFVGGRGWRPEWSPDGRAIAFVSPTDGRIGLVAADSGAPRDLYVPGEGGPSAELAIFSADGRAVYFKSHDARGRATFWSLPATGGRPRLLARFDDPARASNRFDFASDGRRFYFTIEDRQSDVWIAEVARR